MAGTSTPVLAAVVTNAGALGSIGVGATDAPGARAMIETLRSQTTGPFNVNVFCHRPAMADAGRERAWLEALKPIFAHYGAKPPETIQEIYTSFVADAAMLELFLETRPAVVSFHFGLPFAETIAKLKAAGIVLFSTATNLAEARAAAAAGVDAIVAQGYEAGGHRGMFDPAAPDSQLGILALTRILVHHIDLPVIAAGGIMDGAGIAAALDLGAQAAQLGTAFIACPESSADRFHRDALLGPGAAMTQMTALISGRAGPLPAEQVHRTERCGAQGPRGPRLSDRIRCRQSPGDGRTGTRRRRLRRPTGRPGRTARAPDAGGRTRQRAARRTRYRAAISLSRQCRVKRDIGLEELRGRGNRPSPPRRVSRTSPDRRPGSSPSASDERP
ncbi:MAG: nitronate monooxygenase [Rhizomicrobium sp.]